MDGADDVERTGQVTEVVPERLALDDDGLDLDRIVQDKEPLAPQVAQRLPKLTELIADDVRPEAAVRPVTELA